MAEEGTSQGNSAVNEKISKLSDSSSSISQASKNISVGNFNKSNSSDNSSISSINHELQLKEPAAQKNLKAILEDKSDQEVSNKSTERVPNVKSMVTPSNLIDV